MTDIYILTIDQGNSNTSATLFCKEEVVHCAKNLEEILNLIIQYRLTNDNTKAIVSNVTKNHLDLSPLASTEISNWFIGKKFLSMPVNYSSGLGQDRLAGGYFVYKNYSNSWIIDSGTFTTIDFVSDIAFEGGFILPGVDLIQNTYKKGANLFSTSIINWDYPSTLPQNSAEAIELGASLTIFEPLLKAITLKPYNSILVTGGMGGAVYEALRVRLPTASIHFIPNLLHLSLFNMAQEEFSL